MGKKLKFILKKNSGRSNTGQVVVRHQGGRQKRFLRVVDFKRNKKDIKGQVVAIEYDPNRTVDLALLNYTDGEKRYILAPQNLKVGEWVTRSDHAEIKDGNALQIVNIPVGTAVHNLELVPGQGGKLVRSAGSSAVIVAKEEKYAQIKMPSGELRKVLLSCVATVGRLGNMDLKDKPIGKAGRSRLMGIRPTVRGTAQNPRSHPHGGGEGRSGIGMSTPKTYVGRPAVGRTRKKKRYSNKYIISRRKGKH